MCLSAVTVLSLLAFSAFAILDLETANRWTIGARDLVTGYFGWLLITVVSGVLFLAIALVFHPNASRRLGHANERPEFSRWSWFAMLFSAGLASGLVYWGAAEPITHLAGNPFIEADASDPRRATQAVTLTAFHWGLHGWGLYAIGGLAIGLSAYRRGRPLSFSAAIAPIIGEQRANGWAGRLLDLFALYGTVFGVATSIGLAVGSMNATVTALAGIPFNLYTQLGMVLTASLLGVLSVLSGVARGIRLLSEINLWLSVALLGVLLLSGPTLLLLTAIPMNVADYAISAIPMGLWIANDADDQSWQAAWTIFYWGWWLAWMPFVSLFIARISRGRTVREFILGVLLVPALIVVLWMTVLGGSAIHQELANPGAVGAAVAADYSQGLVAMIQNLNRPMLATSLLAVVTLLLFTWLITSLDSATLVICHILNQTHLGGMKVLWGLILACVTSALMLIGGLEALQAASIVIGLPMALVMLLLAASTVKLIVSEETPGHATCSGMPLPGPRRPATSIHKES